MVMKSQSSFSIGGSSSLLVPSRMNFMTMIHNRPMVRETKSILTETPLARFSLKMRKVKAKLEAKGRVKKFKLKTKKSA